MLKTIAPADLGLPVLAARLADLPYQVESFDEVAAGVASLLRNVKLLHFQDQELMGTNAVWCMCEGEIPGGGEGKALFLVFRGTISPTDAIADVMFRPESGPNGVMCHGGFLRTLTYDAVLLAKLKEHAVGDVPGGSTSVLRVRDAANNPRRQQR